MMRMLRGACLIVGLLAGTGHAQHFDLVIFQHSSGLTAGGYDFEQNVLEAANVTFESELEVDAAAPGVAFSSDPGWNALGNLSSLPSGSSLLPASAEVTVRAIPIPGMGSNLVYWNGLGDISFGAVPSGEVLRYFLGPVRQFVANGANAATSTLLLGETSAAGALHVHANFALYGNSLLDDLSADAPTPGVYLMSMEAAVEGISGATNPVYVVFGHGVEETEIDAAIDWVNAAIVPEPSVGLAGLIGLSGILSLRRRGR